MSGNTMPPETAEQARLIYPVSAASNKIANSAAEDAAMMLFNIKLQIKTLEDQEDMLASRLQGYMAEAESLMSVDGRVLATWKSAKSSTKFSATLFKESMPEVYNKYVVETPGSRRFLVKGNK
jgi:predicted phage-related endonuclease